MQKAIDENPTYVLFNGSEGALTGDRALRGEDGRDACACTSVTAARTSSRASTSSARSSTRCGSRAARASRRTCRRRSFPAGGAAIADFRLEVPGTYILVDHSIFRAFNKGALAMLKVEGAERKDIYSGKEVDSSYLGDQVASLARRRQGGRSAKAAGTLTKEEQIEARARRCSRAPARSATRTMARACRTCSRRSRSPTTSWPTRSARSWSC